LVLATTLAVFAPTIAHAQAVRLELGAPSAPVWTPGAPAWTPGPPAWTHPAPAPPMQLAPYAAPMLDREALRLELGRERLQLIVPALAVAASGAAVIAGLVTVLCAWLESVHPPEAPPHQETLGWTLLGAGAAALVGSAIWLALENGDVREIRRELRDLAVSVGPTHLTVRW
jgi:hypothetical protein